MSRGYLRGADRQPLLSKKRDVEFKPTGQVQNVKAAKVYVFGNDQIVDDEEEYELEMSEIRSRRGGFQPNQPSNDEPSFFERELDEGDTLQKISLQYACPISEIKRINNLIGDQEFYALRTVKVPIKRYGVLSEIIEEEEKRRKSRAKYSSRINGASPGETEHLIDSYDDPESPHDFSDPETQMKIIHTLSIRDNMQSQSREAKNFLKNMDRDLSRMMKTRTDRNSLDEVISVLTNKTFHPLERSQSKIYNGADCGFTYWKVIALVILICLVVPAVGAFIYFYEK